MKRIVILGKTNVGKTLFLLNFTEYLGAKDFTVSIRRPGGATNSERLKFREARERLVGYHPHKTQARQEMDLEFPLGKGRQLVKIVDTTGLTEAVHGQQQLRAAMADSLRAAREADIVLHLIDASMVFCKESPEAMGELDIQLARFARSKDGYVVLANKMDLPGSRRGLGRIREALGEEYIIPISALRKQGFREVRRFVAGRV